MTVEITPPIVSGHKIPFFLIPRKIVSDDLLRVLTGEALAMYLLISFKLYRRRTTPDCFVSDVEMQMTIDADKTLVRAARNELRARGLIEFQLCSQGARYRFNEESLRATG